jgi:hypothetical protein
MQTLFIVQQNIAGTDIFTKPIRAFKCPIKAKEYADDLWAKSQRLDALVDTIYQWIRAYRGFHQEPRKKEVNYTPDNSKSFVENSKNYVDNVTFLEPIYDSAYRQEYEEWFSGWYQELITRLEAIGEVPFSDSELDDPRHDQRNLGIRYRYRTVGYDISPIEFDDYLVTNSSRILSE